MITAKEVAKYFLSKDNDKKMFNTNLVEFHNRKAYEGNIRLNKYLYFQSMYLLLQMKSSLLCRRG